MAKRAVVELRGNLQKQGFYVTLRIETIYRAEHSASTIVEGRLPPSLALYETLTHWQKDYRWLSVPSRALKPHTIRTDGRILPLDACVQSAQRLVSCFQQWLSADTFRPIDFQLRQAFMPDDAIDVVIRTSDEAAQALPWHQWGFIETYRYAEVSISSAPISKPGQITSPPQEINILAVLGDRTNIDIESDRRLLNQLPGASVEVLVEPSHVVLNDRLYDRPWHILFFAGHSETGASGQGILRLNSTTTLTIEEVRYALQRAIGRGLQLAIFNSCDGLGLARALDALQLPQMIVMREAVPDLVAQQFLRYFLESLSQGADLPVAVRQARERLQGLEKTYPCASWLPIVYQQLQPSVLKWPQPNQPINQPISQSMSRPDNGRVAQDNQPERSPITMEKADQLKRSPGTTENDQQPENQKPSFLWPFLKHIGITLAVSSVVMVGEALGMLQRWELQTFDRLMEVRPGQGIADERILVIAVGEDDIQYQDNQGYDRTDSLADEALLTLLEKISPHRPTVIGLDIIRTVPLNDNLQGYLEQQPLVAICSIKNITNAITSVPPPPQYPAEYLGFNNIPLDTDGVIRRQLLGMASKDVLCPAQESFSFHIARTYLRLAHDIEMEWVTDNKGDSQVQLGAQVFTSLRSRAGGYQLSAGDIGGKQVLVNYRAAHPEQVSLKDILSGALDTQLPELVGDRIILIGLVHHSTDNHLIPHSLGRSTQTLPGVIVQAHMASQVISATFGERPLIQGWPEWADRLWIVGWAIAGTVIGVVAASGQPSNPPPEKAEGRSLWKTIGIVLMGLGGVGSSGVLLLVQGWWVPSVAAAIALCGTATVSYCFRPPLDE
ncbi:MAG: CHASE2 domain-containing protein [Cyanobacteria bacterium P01_F01_bin.150]